MMKGAVLIGPGARVGRQQWANYGPVPLFAGGRAPTEET